MSGVYVNTENRPSIAPEVRAVTRRNAAAVCCVFTPWLGYEYFTIGRVINAIMKVENRHSWEVRREEEET